jgi:GWxTD domain-containing protein
VSITLRDGATVVRSTEAHESVLVASFKETSRTDESVLYEEILTVPPGRYDFSVSVRDDGAARVSEDNATLAVPRLGSSGMSTPVSFATAGLRSRLGALPQLIVNPTASATFGRDSVIPFLIEAYGSSERERQLQYAVRAENGRLIYRDSAALTLRTTLHAGTLQVPLSRIGIGAMQLVAWIPGSNDTVRAPMFVGFGPDLPLASFEEMVNYLRWFASPYRIQQLRDATPEARPAAWMEFVRQATGESGATDGLRDYFNRMIEANTRFREEASPGWMTDRGKVLLGLGRPDQVYEQMGRSFSQQGRQQSWEYRNLNLVLTFYDQNGFGRWRLTQSSESEFMTAWRRRVQ